MVDDLESFIKKYIKLKDVGEICSIEEARDFYTDVFNLSKATYVEACMIEATNFAQDIPLDIVDEEPLEYMLDDLDFIQEKAVTLKTILNMAWDLYHNPDKYNAWKGEIDGQVVYYVELKGSHHHSKAEDKFYI